MKDVTATESFRSCVTTIQRMSKSLIKNGHFNDDNDNFDDFDDLTFLDRDNDDFDLI